jgi:chromosome segregation ATPase
VLLSEDEKGALLTAAAVLDQEVDRLLNILRAREEIAKFTTGVRQLLHDIETVPGQLAQRTGALQGEIARGEAALTRIQERVAAAKEEHALLLDTLKAEAAPLRTRLDEEHARVKAERQGLAAESEAMRSEYEKEREALTAKLATLQADIAKAEALRKELTTL